MIEVHESRQDRARKATCRIGTNFEQGNIGTKPL